MKNILVLYLVIQLVSGCAIFKKADRQQEIKHPGYYLKGKGKVLSQTPDSVMLKLTIKNTARKTSYKNFDLLVQMKKKDGSPSCSFGRKFQTVPLKPKRRQKIYYTLHCPKAEANSIEFLNIYGDTISR